MDSGDTSTVQFHAKWSDGSPELEAEWKVVKWRYVNFE
jgi:hypothetical protein